MGARGNRTITGHPSYSEPDLMKGVDDLLKQARDNGCYDGDKLNVEKLVNYVCTKNPDECIDHCFHRTTSPMNSVSCCKKARRFVLPIGSILFPTRISL